MSRDIGFSIAAHAMNRILISSQLCCIHCVKLLLAQQLMQSAVHRCQSVTTRLDPNHAACCLVTVWLLSLRVPDNLSEDRAGQFGDKISLSTVRSMCAHLYLVSVCDVAKTNHANDILNCMVLRCFFL